MNPPIPGSIETEENNLFDSAELTCQSLSDSTKHWILVRKTQNSGKDHLVWDKDNIPWNGETYFPSCRDEFLLYLILAGSPQEPGRDSKREK